MKYMNLVYFTLQPKIKCSKNKRTGLKGNAIATTQWKTTPGHARKREGVTKLLGVISFRLYRTTKEKPINLCIMSRLTIC